MNNYTWYQKLKKPTWAPPGWLFGPVWSVLYVVIAVTFGWIFMLVAQGRAPLALAVPFALNLVFNVAFTPLQFGLKSNRLAAVDVLLTLVTLVWAVAAAWPFAPWVTLTLIPYLLWVSFATVLQLTVTWLNWKA